MLDIQPNWNWLNRFGLHSQLTHTNTIGNTITIDILPTRSSDRFDTHTHTHNRDQNPRWNTHTTTNSISVDTHTITQFGTSIAVHTPTHNWYNNHFCRYPNPCDYHRNWHYTLNDFGFSWLQTSLWHKHNDSNTYLWRVKQLTSTQTRLISIWSCWKRIHRQ